jgi:hypothetical protein
VAREVLSEKRTEQLPSVVQQDREPEEKHSNAVVAGLRLRKGRPLLIGIRVLDPPPVLLPLAEKTQFFSNKTAKQGISGLVQLFL